MSRRKLLSSVNMLILRLILFNNFDKVLFGRYGRNLDVVWYARVSNSWVMCLKTIFYFCTCFLLIYVATSWFTCRNSIQMHLPFPNLTLFCAIYKFFSDSFYASKCCKFELCQLFFFLLIKLRVHSHFLHNEIVSLKCFHASVFLVVAVAAAFIQTVSAVALFAECYEYCIEN